MLSRWNMTERASGNHGLLQVQYAFLELPKLSQDRPETGTAYWAWLFVHAPQLTAVPPDLPAGPHREALELANEATFSQAELDAYRKVMDEIQQAREFGEVKWREGETAGVAKGKVDAKIEAVLAIITASGLSVSVEVRARIEACKDASVLDGWIVRAATASTAEEVLATAGPRP
jgi:hypothetical protein